MTISQAELILNGVGLKCTPGRVQLLELMIRDGAPLSHDEIARELAMDRVSIYRALEAFLKTGIIHKVESGDRIWRFAFCGCKQQGHCHPHFICRACGKVECLKEFQIPDNLQVKAGYRVEEREYYLKGLCAHCS